MADHTNYYSSLRVGSPGRSRRAVLGSLLAGSIGVLAACRPGPARGSVGAGPNESVFLATTNSADGVTAPSGSAPDRANPTAPGDASSSGLVASLTAVPPSPTPVPTVQVQPTATLTPVPTLPPTPTTIPYVAARLTTSLGQSVTSYAGSIAPRVHNVQLATRLINGATVAPGATFSFDDRVGPQTLDAGFQTAWGIVSHAGGPQTVPSVAGGICQVATTLFQAVYWAGLRIVERHHHLYWIAHYGQPPYGQQGLDATVDFPPVDFRFANNTSDWIRIVGSYDSTHVRFHVYGAKTGWKVTSSPTKITNLVKTDRKTIQREDPTKPYGYKLWIEAAEDGFDATVTRLVTKGDEVVDRYVFTNHYNPAHNVLLVGTKGAPPTATPTTVPPSPTATSAPGLSPSPTIQTLQEDHT